MAQQDIDYYRLFSTNAYKGETYIIKFKKNSIIYTGIPIIREGITGSSDTFQFKVVEPSQSRGIIQKPIKEIDYVKVIETK
jgi:hypothetical protein